MVRSDANALEGAFGPFHVHRGHDFEGFEIEETQSRAVLLARCACGAVLDVADAVFAPCPACGGARAARCARCGGSGQVVDHAALRWRLPAELSTG
jgi:predicted RNA-binding Zn-ribbon protein involved in translation (DUF1610 family)